MERFVSSSARRIAGRSVGPALSLLIAWSAPLAAHAEQQGDPADSTASLTLNERAVALASPAIAIRPMVTVESSPAAVGGVQPHGARLTNAPVNGGSASIVDYRAWLGAGRASFGVGLTTSAYRDTMIAGPLLVSPGAPMLGVGLRYQLSRDSQLTFDSLASGRGDDLSPRLRVGMEFKSPPSQVLGMARGTLMRVQLSSDSQVSVNWRGGKLGLALRSQF